MDHIRTIAADEDPVCGMRVDVEQARIEGLTLEKDGHVHAFCGKGCLLEFRDDPHKYLSVDYQPSM
jgi:YHS domain-containing protein